MRRPTPEPTASSAIHYLSATAFASSILGTASGLPHDARLEVFPEVLRRLPPLSLVPIIPDPLRPLVGVPFDCSQGPSARVVDVAMAVLVCAPVATVFEPNHKARGKRDLSRIRHQKMGSTQFWPDGLTDPLLRVEPFLLGRCDVSAGLRLEYVVNANDLLFVDSPPALNLAQVVTCPRA